jgi:hypothetical protein
VGLHVVLKGPDPLGEFDVYLTHLTGGGDQVIQAQAEDFASWIADTRGDRPAVVMLGQSDPSGVSTYQVFEAMGLHDVFGAETVGTCCRASILGEQPALTARTDYLMASGWAPESQWLFGAVPRDRGELPMLYPSDHNGLAAVFQIPQAAAANP